MGELAQRQTLAMALLEVEEATHHLALLQAKARNWHKLHEIIGPFLLQMRRDSEYVQGLVGQTREDIRSNLDAMREAMSIDAIFALDAELEAAALRVDEAEAQRKRLGLS